jgi:hypothetical protein
VSLATPQTPRRTEKRPRFPRKTPLHDGKNRKNHPPPSFFSSLLETVRDPLGTYKYAEDGFFTGDFTGVKFPHAPEETPNFSGTDLSQTIGLL